MLSFRFQVCARFHAWLRLSWTSALLAVGITPTTMAGFSKRSPRFTDGIYQVDGLFLTTPFTEGCDGVNVNYQTLPPGRSNTRLEHAVLLVPLRSVQFSSVQLMHLGSTFLSRLRLMLVGVTFGLDFIGHHFIFLDHYVQSSIIKPCPLAARTCCAFRPTSFSSVQCTLVV